MEKRRTLGDGRAVTVHRNEGLRKRCDCARRAWLKCPHPWHFNFKWKSIHYRFPIDRYATDHERITTKEGARAEANRLRAMIQDGRFPPRTVPEITIITSADALTLDDFMVKWREHARDGMKNQQQASDASRCKRLGNLQLTPEQRFGAKAIGAITEDDIETAFKRLGDTMPGSSWNKYRQLVIHLQRWGQKKGYLTRPWIVFSKDSTIKRQKHARRDRRLVPDVLDERGRVKTPGEERRLLDHASPWLQRLIIAALETCCRRGELLSLQWRDVDLNRGTFRVRAEKSKTHESREIPISVRLRGVLDMVRQDPDGDDHPPQAYVFGNVIGEQLKDPKKAWAACLKATGLAEADLHFHDLRHEGASRYLEQGWPLQHVQAMLGHADAKTTSIYLNVTTHQLTDSMRRFPGAARPLPTPVLHAVAHVTAKSVGRARNGSPSVPGNVLVN